MRSIQASTRYVLAAGATMAALAAPFALVPTHEAAEAGPIEAPAPRSDTYDPMRSFAPLVEAVEPAVLSVDVVKLTRSDYPGGMDLPPGFREFFGDRLPFPESRGPRRAEGNGSGFVISADGLVLTNQHVVEGAQEMTARFADGREVALELVGSDKESDIALLRLAGDRDDWAHVQLADDGSVEVGDWVVAVGNPLGLGLTVTAGIVSGTGRNLGGGVWEDFLQTDAAINQGNSGGPLFDLEGKVVGMNTAIIGGANTVGFSIPTPMIRSVMNQLEETGRVERGFLGVGYQPLSADLAASFGLAADTEGVVVTSVAPDSAADAAGLLEGDVVVTVDGEPVGDRTGFARSIGGHRPGEKVRLGVIRDGRRRVLTATLGVREQATAAAPPAEAPRRQDTEAPLGLAIGPVSPQLAERVGTDGGVEIREVDAESPLAGRLKPGDVVLRVNNREVKGPGDFAELVERAGQAISFLVVRGSARIYVTYRRE